jgi:hypothetical protein
MEGIWSIFDKLPVERLVHHDDNLIYLDYNTTESLLGIRRLVPEASAIPDGTLLLLWEDFSTYWVCVGFHHERWDSFVTYVVAVLVRGIRSIGTGSSEASVATAIITSMIEGRSFEEAAAMVGSRGDA